MRRLAALAGADEVYAASADHPLAGALDVAEVVLRVPEDAPDGASTAGFLLRRARTATVVWLLGPDGDAGLTDALAGHLVAAADDGRPTRPRSSWWPGPGTCRGHGCSTWSP